MTQARPTLDSAFTSFLTRLVEQTTRSHAADDETHAAEDGDNSAKEGCYDETSFTEFVKNWPVAKETKQLYQHIY